MPTTSENIKRLETVDLIVSGYEWQCVSCGMLNHEPSIETMIVQCTECIENFRVSETWE